MLKTSLGALALSATFLIPASAIAQEVDFAGETIKLIVPYGTGGGSGIHARLLAPLMEQELPGNPTIVIENIEGGGSVKGLNQFAQEAKPDGLMLGATGTGSYYAFMLGADTVKYPLADFIPVIASPYGFVIYGRKDMGLTGEPMHDLDLLRANPPVYVGDGPASGDMPAIFCYDLRGIEILPVWGVSRGDSRQAFLRGESQINMDNLATWGSDLQPLVDDGTMVPLFTMGFLDENGEIGRDPTQPDIPTCLELYEQSSGQKLEGVQREIYDAMYAVRMSVAKTFMLPPGTPPEIVAAYDEAMARVVERPELKDPLAQSELGGYPQLLGEEARAGHARAAAMSEEARETLIKWLRDEWNADI